jgi:NADH-quinone oxidoreductase subunit N
MGDCITDIIISMPEILIAVMGMILLLLGVIKGNSSTKPLTFLSIVVLAIALYYLYSVVPDGNITAYNSLFVTDSFIKFAKTLVLVGAAVVLVLFLGLKPAKQSMLNSFEYPVLILYSVLGMMIMLSANDFLVFYLGLELQALCLYVLASIERNDAKSSEAGLKYFVLGALASGILLYGISLIYGFTGTTNFGVLFDLYEIAISPDAVTMGTLIGLILFVIAMSFKVSAAPFHMWTPDVYQGAPTITTSYFAIVPKAAVVLVFARFLYVPFGQWVGEWQQVIIFISAASMLVGAFGALRQTNIKRLLAYSSIGHVGYLLIGLATASKEGMQAMLIYVTLYMIMSAGMFACVLMMNRGSKAQEDIGSLAGLSKTNPAFAFMIAVMMFSMAGIPPLAGFFGKFYIFLGAINSGLFVLATIGVVSSVIAAYYYLKIVKIMYLDKPAEVFDKNASNAHIAIATLAAAINLVFFLMPTELVKLALDVTVVP